MRRPKSAASGRSHDSIIWLEREFAPGLEARAVLLSPITQAGAGKNGYVTSVMGPLNREGLQLTHVAAGQSGNRSNDMLARLEKSVISKNPDWMTLSCGVNDVWHFTLRLGNRSFEGVSLEDYKVNVRKIIEEAQAAEIKVIILTSTMIGEDPEKESNQKLIPYNEFLREIAKEKSLPLADLSKDMQAALKEIPDVAGQARMFGEPKYQRHIKNKLTSDGCHMNTLGNIMLAKDVLKASGLREGKIAAAENPGSGSE